MKKAGEGEGRETNERREDTYKYNEREGEVGHTLESWEAVNTERGEGRYT
jgi:hypothetical protein